MTNPKHDEDLARAIAETLRAREQAVPDEVTAQLAAARREAVAEMEKLHPETHRYNKPGPRTLLSAGGLAAAAVAAFLLWPRGATTIRAPVLDEKELAAAADMELLDDIEFIAWVLEEESNAG